MAADEHEPTRAYEAPEICDVDDDAEFAVAAVEAPLSKNA